MSIKITPIEIRQKTFERVFRGYEKQEVQAFLNSLAKEWERLQSENKEYKSALEQAKSEIAKLRAVEESLFKTLKTAEDTRSTLINQASKAADLQMKETQMTTNDLLTEARTKARDIVEMSEKKSQKIIENAQNEVKKMQKKYTTIEQHQDHLISSLKILSQDILSKLQRMDKIDTSSTENAFEGYLSQVQDLRETSISNSDLNLEKVSKILKKSPSRPAFSPQNEEKSLAAASLHVPASTSTLQKDVDKAESGSFFDKL